MSQKSADLFYFEAEFWKREYRGAYKSLARPGRKQATTTKPLLLQANQKKNSENFRPTRSPRQQWPPRRTKNGELSTIFSV